MKRHFINTFGLSATCIAMFWVNSAIAASSPSIDITVNCATVSKSIASQTNRYDEFDYPEDCEAAKITCLNEIKSNPQSLQVFRNKITEANVKCVSTGLHFTKILAVTVRLPRPVPQYSSKNYDPEKVSYAQHNCADLSKSVEDNSDRYNEFDSLMKCESLKMRCLNELNSEKAKKIFVGKLLEADVECNKNGLLGNYQLNVKAHVQRPIPGIHGCRS